MILAFSKDEDEQKRTLVGIGSKLVDALKFIHGRGYCHNDISPKNILFNEAKEQPFLVDFALASEQEDKIKGFRGTACFAHRSIFAKYPSVAWNSKSLYDYTSLALRMAASF